MAELPTEQEKEVMRRSSVLVVATLIYSKLAAEDRQGIPFATDAQTAFDAAEAFVAHAEQIGCDVSNARWPDRVAGLMGQQPLMGTVTVKCDGVTSKDCEIQVNGVSLTEHVTAMRFDVVGGQANKLTLEIHGASLLGMAVNATVTQEIENRLQGLRLHFLQHPELFSRQRILLDEVLGMLEQVKGQVLNSVQREAVVQEAKTMAQLQQEVADLQRRLEHEHKIITEYGDAIVAVETKLLKDWQRLSDKQEAAKRKLLELWHRERTE